MYTKHTTNIKEEKTGFRIIRKARKITQLSDLITTKNKKNDCHQQHGDDDRYILLFFL